MAKHRRHRSYATYEYEVGQAYIRLFGRHPVRALAPSYVARVTRDFWNRGYPIMDAARSLGVDAGEEGAT